MDLAIVTGASGRLGQTLCRKLLELGFRVYGWDHDFSKCVLHHRDFIRVPCDLSSPDTVQSAWEAVEAEQGTLMVLVHAGILPEAGPFECLDPAVLTHSLQSALHAPVLLTRLSLPSLIRFRGHVVTVGWNGRGHPRYGALEAAVQGGLYHFGQELFRELRDTGVKVTHLYPEQVQPADDGAARLQEPQSLVDPSLVAEALGQVLQFKEHNLIGEMVIRPRGSRENPKIANTAVHLVYGPHEVRLPSREDFPVEPEPIPTPKRERPADAPPPELCLDDEEDEDDELDRLMEQSRQYLKSQVKQSSQPTSPAKKQRIRETPSKKDGETPSPEQTASGDSDSGNRRRRRRRRRGGRSGRGGQQPEGKPGIPGGKDVASVPEGRPPNESVAKKESTALKPERKSRKNSKSGDAVASGGQAKSGAKPEKKNPVTVQSTPPASTDSAPKAAKKIVKKTTKKTARKAVKKVAKKVVPKRESKKNTQSGSER